MRKLDQNQTFIVHGISVLLVFAALARGAHDLWAATLVYLGVLTLLLTFVSLKSSSGKNSLISTQFLIPIGFLVLIFSISSYFSVHPSESIFELKDWIFGLVLFWLAVHVFQSDKAVETLITWMVPVFWIQFPVCIYLYFSDPGFVEKWGTLVNANVMVAFLLPWVPVLIEKIINTWPTDSQKKWFWVSGLIALLGSFGTALSTWGWICLVLAFPFFFGLGVIKKIIKKNPVLIGILVGIGFLILGYIIYRKLTWVYEWHWDLPPRSSTSRFFWWGSGLLMFKEFPFFGVGLGNFPSAFLAFKLGSGQHTLYPHSFFVGLLAETGTAGILAAVAFFGSWKWALFKNWSSTEKRWSFLVGIGLLVLFCSISIGLEFFAVLMVLLIFMGIVAAPSVSLNKKPRRSAAWIMAILVLGSLPYLVSPFVASQNFVAGKVFLKEGKILEAHEKFMQAVQLDPLLSEGHEYLAQSLFVLIQGDLKKLKWKDIIDHQKKAISLDRLNGRLWWGLGQIWERAGDKNESENAYQQAVKFHKSNKQFQNDLARIQEN